MCSTAGVTTGASLWRWRPGLCSVPGVVAHGLFLDYARAAYVATSDGVRVLGS